jgi:uncharacterized protein (TIGR03067 family)
MRWRAFTIAAAGLLIAATAPTEEMAKQDLKQIEGTWTITHYEQDGVIAGPELLMQLPKVIFRGQTYTWSDGSGSGTLKIDPSKTPKEVDYTITKGEGKGESYFGIYEIEGDTFMDCFTLPGGKRPTEFKAPFGSGRILTVYKRRIP